MSYRDMLVVLDTDASARVRNEIAAALAERFAAHLVGLYPLPTPEAPRHFGYYDPALLHPFFEELRARARDAADKTRQAFEHIASRHGVSANGVKFPRGRMPTRLSTLARLSHYSRPARSQ